MLHDIEHRGIKSYVFSSASTWNNQGVIGRSVDIIKRCIEHKMMASFLAISLLALKVVYCRNYRFASLFSGAYDMNIVAYHLQNLVGHHDFVVFNVIPNKH